MPDQLRGQYGAVESTTPQGQPRSRAAIPNSASRPSSQAEEYSRPISFPNRLLHRVKALRSPRISRFLLPEESNESWDSALYSNSGIQDEDALMSVNGRRVWYESYTTIDWIHDSIKESSRMRRLRSMMGYRGVLVNTWDRLQGWIVVTLTGVVTAIIAGWIIQSEALLFDLKEGYCHRDWRLAKRFCCPYAGGPDWDGDAASSSLLVSPAVKGPSKGLSTRFSNQALAGWAGPVASSPRWAALTEDGSCPGWITWGDRFSFRGESNWAADYGMYVCVALLWATAASLLTVYLTSSELYASKKDGPSASSPSNISYRNGNSNANESTPLLDTDGDNSAPRSPAADFITKMASHKRSEEAIGSRKILYFGSGSGISEVKCILSGFVVHGYLGFWTLFTKSVGLTLSVASGLSLGKEGPFVHIASCVGNIISRFFSKYERNESKRREILSCACAAGVAVAFGAPVGGVLFSLEEVSYYFPAKVMFRSFFCAMVAAATLRALDPFGTGKIVLFQVTYDRDWHWIELLFFVIIGLFGGLYGAFFTRLNVIWSTQIRAKTWMARHPVYEVAMITVISVAFTFLNGYTRMSGPELVADLFGECHEHESLDGLCVSKASEIGPLLQAILFAMISKGLLTVITFGIKLPAGIFIPTLAVGACFGRIVGLLVQYTQWTRPDSVLFQWCPKGNSSCIVPGVYAMVGAAAALSGVTRTTVSLVVIMFELTGTLTYAVPVMLSVLVAKTVADAIEHKGIYDLVLQFSGLPYLDAKQEHTWQDVSIQDAIDTDVELIVLDQDNTVDSLRHKLQRLAQGLGYTDGGFPLVVQKGGLRESATKRWKLVGYIAAQELEHGLNRLVSSDSDTDPAQLACTFRHIPIGQSSSDEANVAMRDSLFLTMEEPSDLSVYVDKAPLTISTSSPLELVHQLFVKLGVRYLIVLDLDGSFNGLIFKKRWLAFLASIEH